MHFVGSWTQHIIVFLSGATGLSIIGHAVSTFPTPANKYGIWLLGILQYIVGQRVAASNTFQGLQTVTAGVTTAQKQEIDTENGQADMKNVGPKPPTA